MVLTVTTRGHNLDESLEGLGMTLILSLDGDPVCEKKISFATGI
jgi:hypothetical protein